jgi:hypothetical protein
MKAIQSVELLESSRSLALLHDILLINLIDYQSLLVPFRRSQMLKFKRLLSGLQAISIVDK